MDNISDLDYLNFPFMCPIESQLISPYASVLTIFDTVFKFDVATKDKIFYVIGNPCRITAIQAFV